VSTTIYVTFPAGPALTFDTSFESYRPTASVTKHPVEALSGQLVSISDHAQLMPMQFTVRGLMTETPLANYGGFSLTASEIGIPPSGPERVIAARKFLLGLVGSLCSVTTDRFGYVSNVVLTAVPHEVKNERSVWFDCQFEQINLATVGASPLPISQLASAVANGASTAAQAGQQAGSTFDLTSLPKILTDHFGLTTPGSGQ